MFLVPRGGRRDFPYNVFEDVCNRNLNCYLNSLFWSKFYRGITYAFAVTSAVRVMRVDLHVGASIESVQSSK